MGVPDHLEGPWDRRIRKWDKPKGWYIEMYSMGELLDWVQRAPDGSKGDGMATKGGNAYWNGTHTWQQALNLARLGWSEPLAKFRQFRDPLVNRLSALIEREEYLPDVEGVDFDISQVMSGDPEHWWRYQTHIAKGAGKVLKVVCNISVNGGISQESFFARGAAVAALIECLEIAGIRTELWVGDSGAGSLGQLSIRCLIKRAGDPIDLPRLAFVYAHMSMERRLMFKFCEIWPEIYEGIGYGWAAEIYHAPDELYIASLSQNWHPKNIEEFVVSQLEAQGVELK